MSRVRLAGTRRWLPHAQGFGAKNITVGSILPTFWGGVTNNLLRYHVAFRAKASFTWDLFWVCRGTCSGVEFYFDICIKGPALWGYWLTHKYWGLFKSRFGPFGWKPNFNRVYLVDKLHVYRGYLWRHRFYFSRTGLSTDVVWIWMDVMQWLWCLR